jgi:hypothetical protein
MEPKVITRQIFHLALPLFVLMSFGCSPSEKNNSPSQSQPQPTSPRSPTNPPIGEDALAKSSQKSSCAAIPAEDAGHQEIFVEDVADGKDGSYRLIEANLFTQTDFIAQNKTTRFVLGLKLSPYANLDDPDSKITVDCKEMNDAPEGDMSGAFHAPIMITKKDGSLIGNISADYILYGSKVGSTDKLNKYYHKDGRYSSLRSLQKALAESGTAHIYRIDETHVEILSAQKAENDQKRYQIVSKYIYVYSP